MIRGTDAFDKWQEYGLDVPARRIILDDGIDDAGRTGAICCDLLWLDKTKGPIELWINCPGGWASAMWALYDLMQTASNPIITVGLGEVSSAAVLLLAAGTGTRYVMPNTTLMHHQSRHGRDATHRELIDYARWAEQDEERWIRALARHTKTPYRKWKEKSGGEWYMVGEELISAGIADELWTHPGD